MNMSGLLKSALVVSAVSATAAIWGVWYRSNHAMEGAMGMLFGGAGAAAYTTAGWAMGLGILAFLVGIGLLIAALVQQGKGNQVGRPPA